MRSGRGGVYFFCFFAVPALAGTGRFADVVAVASVASCLASSPSLYLCNSAYVFRFRW